MAYTEQSPPPHLAHLVECLWALERGPAEAVTELQFLPDGMAEIVIGQAWGADPRTGSAFVVGPLTRSRPFPWHGAFSALGIRLRPGAVGPVFGMPARALRDRTPTVEELLGCSPRRDEDPTGRLSALVDFVDSRAARPDPALADLLAEVGAGATRIGAALVDRGVAERTLRRAFDREVGLSPAMFLRVTRFRRLLAEAADVRPRTWADRATAAGYYDQAHMNREVRSLAGVSPTRLLAPCVSVLS